MKSYELFFMQGDEFLDFNMEYKNPDENNEFWERIENDYLCVLTPVEIKKLEDFPNEDTWEKVLSKNETLIYKEDSTLGYCSLTLMK